MASLLKQRIQEDMKAALRVQDKSRLSVIRMILAAIKQIEVDERVELDDTRIFQTLNKMLKQRRDSILQYSQAKRDDLVQQERFEETIIQAYLPKALTEKEVNQLLSETIEQVGASSIQDMGKVMAELKLKLEGRADIGLVSIKVKERLSSS